MRYRIIETSDGFYPQEKKHFIHSWQYLDNAEPSYTWVGAESQSFVKTYDEAVKIVERRKEYLEAKNFKKIHNL